MCLKVKTEQQIMTLGNSIPWLDRIWWWLQNIHALTSCWFIIPRQTVVNTLGDTWQWLSSTEFGIFSPQGQIKQRREQQSKQRRASACSSSSKREMTREGDKKHTHTSAVFFHSIMCCLMKSLRKGLNVRIFYATPGREEHHRTPSQCLTHSAWVTTNLKSIYSSPTSSLPGE